MVINQHKNWWCCIDRDAYYCGGCKAVVTKEQLFKWWQEDETLNACLDRIAFMEGFKDCEEQG